MKEKLWILIGLLIIALLLICLSIQAAELEQTATITATWQLNDPSENVVEYQLFMSTESSSYDFDNPICTTPGTETSCTVENIPIGAVYYFVLKAKNDKGLFSDPSNEISKDLTNPLQPNLDNIEVTITFKVI